MAIDFKQFYDASLDIRYALRGQLFQPDLANITRIFKMLLEGNALSVTEKNQVLDPMNQFLKRYDEESKFRQLFENPNKADLSTRTFLFEVIEALLQKYNESCYDESHRDLLAFQAIASSLHKEVLSSSVKVQDTKVWQIMQRTLFPMARWGMDGPYTYAPQGLPAEYTGNRVTIVRLPVALRYDGLLAWSSISHEIGGHHFLSALPNLFLKIKDTVFEKLLNAEEIDEKYRHSLANYWSTCSLELASDVLGVRNLGPAFAIGLAGYLIGVRDELQTSGLLHSKDIKSRRALGLTFPDEKTLWISELHPDIRIPSNNGIFGKIVHNDQATEVRFTRKIIPSEKHPLDILRLYATRTLIETLINSYPERDPEKVPAEYLALSILDDVIEKTLGEEKEVEFKIPVQGEVDSQAEPRSFLVPIAEARNSSDLAGQAVIKALEDWFSENDCQISDLITWDIFDSELVEFLKEPLKSKVLDEIPTIPTHLFPQILPNKLIIRHVLSASIMIAVSNPAVSRQHLFNNMKHWLRDAGQKMVAVGMNAPETPQ